LIERHTEDLIEESISTWSSFSAENITLWDIMVEPKLYVGRTVTVVGGVDEVYSEHAFAILSDELVAADAVLILTANEGLLDTALAGDEAVEVMGVVRHWRSSRARP
jgi:hypothetical protein